MVVVLALLVLVGWAANILLLTSLHPGWATMKVNTAIGFVLAGAALFFVAPEPTGRVYRNAGTTCSALTVLLGILTLAEYALGADFGIDQLLFVDSATAANAYPGRMSPATAVHFVMVGMALMLSRNAKAYVVANVLAVLTVLSASIAVTGYAYNVSALYSIGPYASVALHTAILFLTLGAGIVIKEPKRGLMRLVTSPYAGGRAARRLLPFALLVPPVIGWLRLEGQRLDFYGTEFGIALVVVAHVVIFVALILSTVDSLDDADRVRQREREFRSLLESAPDAMVIVDDHGSIVLVNSQAEHLFGYRREELLGRHVEILIPDRFRAGHPAHRATYLAQPRVRPMGATLDLYVRRRDGTEFPVEISLGPLETDRGVLVSCAVRDVTERKRLQSELVASKLLAETANRAKSEFLSSMSHELRTPLNALIGFAQMLELDREGTLTARQREYVAHMLNAGNHLLELVNEVLDLAGVESGKLKLSIERVAVRDMFEQIRLLMAPLARNAGLSFETVVPDGLDDVRADGLRLRQVLLNLVSNAIKYNRANGTATLSAVRQSDERIRLLVKDTGIGIPWELHHELFQPFRRLGTNHNRVEGTGIGLALSRKLIEAMNGTMGFVSEPDVGSTFWVELPIERSPASAATSEAPSAFRPSRAGGYSLLYVEDNPANLRLMEHLLSTLPGVAMLSAPTPQLGLELAIAHRPDVIVLDLNLPGMTGFEVLTRLKAQPETRDIPVVALTAAAFPRDVQKGLAAGFFRYVTKPLDVKVFLAALDDALTLGSKRRPAAL